MKEATRIVLHTTEVNQVFSSESRLSSRGHEDDDWLVRAVILDRQERGAVHRLHERGEAPDLWEAIDEQLQRYRSHRMTEIEQAFFYSKPVSEI